MATARFCLPDEQLFPLCHNDEPGETVRRHVAECATCRARVQILKCELDAIRQFNLNTNSAFATKSFLPVEIHVSSHSIALPSVIGRYPIKKSLGRGGQANVFLGWDPDLGRDVAIKIGLRSMHDRESNDQLRSEGRVLAQLRHPHLAEVYHSDFHDGCPYLVMEFIQGKNLAQHVEHRRLDAIEAVLLMAKVAEGLAAAHGRGVIHQDLKPQNIVIDQQGEPRIIDFGMARLYNAWETSLATTGGTAEYMAPEQAEEFLTGRQSGDADPRRDIFSLGAVLYFLLIGKPPFSGQDLTTKLLAASRCDFDRQPLRSPAIPQAVAVACLKAMSAQPELRHSSASEFADELKRAVARKRVPVWFWIPGAAIVVLLAGLSATYFSRPVQSVPTEQFIISTIERDEDGADPKTPESAEEVSSALPIRDTDRLTFRCQIPQGYSAAFFVVRPDGILTEFGKLDETSAPGDSSWVRYPATGSWQLTGFQGPALLLFCAKPGSAPVKTEVESAFAHIGPDSWPTQFPPRTLLSVQRSKIEPISIDTPRGQANSEYTRVFDHVETVRKNLIEKGDRFLFWGVVLPCVIPDEQ